MAGDELPKLVKEALFEARPYVEYWDRLKETIEKAAANAKNRVEFHRIINEELQRAEEPFRTDLKIFLQKFEALEK